MKVILEFFAWFKSQLSYIQSQYDQDKKRQQDIQAKVGDLKKELENKLNQSKLLYREAVRLEKEIQAVEIERNFAKSYENETADIAQALSQSQQSQQEAQNLQDRIQSKQQELKELQGILHSQSNTLNSACDELGQAGKELQEENDALSLLKQQLEAEKQALDSLQKTLEKSQPHEIHSTEAALIDSTPTNEVEVNEEENKPIVISLLTRNTEELAQKQAEIDNLIATISEKEQKISQISTSRQNIEQRIREAEQAIHQSERNEQNLQNELSQLHQQFEAKKQETERLLNQAGNKQAECERKYQAQSEKMRAESEKNARYLKPNGKWFSQYEAIVGLSHRKSKDPIPCQDSALALSENVPYPIIVIADGAGSSAVSDIGSSAATKGVVRFLRANQSELRSLLDEDNFNDEYQKFAQRTVRYAMLLLKDLALEHRRPVQDFRCTLLAAIVGQKNTLWLKVGDGALVVEKRFSDAQVERFTLGKVGKGEYANQTQFIDDKLSKNDVQSGVIASEHLSALFAMSDGAAERLVKTDGTKTAGKLSAWADELRQDNLNRHHLTTYFYSDEFCRRHSGDDCSIAMIARA